MTLSTTDIIRPLDITLTTEVIPKKKPQKFSLACFIELSKENNGDQLLQVIDAVCSIGYDVSLILHGSNAYQKDLLKLQEKHSKKLHCFDGKKEDRERMLKKADIFFSPKQPLDTDMKSVIEAGVVPVLPEGSLFVNFDPQNESGNAFTFEPDSFWHMVEAIVRARETWKFSYDWRNIKQSVRETVL